MIKCCACAGHVGVDYDVDDDIAIIAHTLPHCSEFEQIETVREAVAYYQRCRREAGYLIEGEGIGDAE